MEKEDGVPCGLDNFPARLLNQYYPPYEPSGGYDLLPLYGNDWYNYKTQRQYSLLENDCLSEKWKKFMCDPALEKNLQFPTTRGNHFINQVARFQPPNEALGYCRAPLSLVPGPLVDEYGPLPIPADYHYRYREKFRSEPKKKIDKKNKNKNLVVTEPPPPPPTPPRIYAPPPPPAVCICPPLPFYCSCPAQQSSSSLSPEQSSPTLTQPKPTFPTSQRRNAICTSVDNIFPPPLAACEDL